MAPGLQIIPTDIIEAWAKGEYFLGDVPSLAYNRLGAALFLRGWYVYVNSPGDKNPLAGVTKIDIKGPMLSMAGIRLLDRGRRTIKFWQTEVSHFADDHEIIWFHTVLNLAPTPEFKAIAGRYVKSSWLSSKRATPIDKQFGMTGAAWNELLNRLHGDFDADVARLRQLCPADKIDHGMLRFKTEPDNKQRHRCEYYQFYSSGSGRGLIRGMSYLTKTSRV